MKQTKTLLDHVHRIVDEDDKSATHDLVEIMFHLLDLDALKQLQEQTIFPKKYNMFYFTNDELHAFSEHHTWIILDQELPLDPHMQSFCDKLLYDNRFDSLSEGKDVDYGECVDHLTDTMKSS
jgi:hypothetical protein|tara:strand:- start:1353 stop:1721 length:369 start_codon:yes stop_codon:yes gene_type:complete